MSTGKTTYWITTAEGTFGQVEGVEERDRWTPLGYEVADEPAATDFVWMRHEGIEQPARFAYDAAPTWQQMGWTFSAPPEPVDPTKDPAVVDQPKQAPAKAAPSASGKAETVTPR